MKGEKNMMHKRMKKLVSIVLCGTMLLGLTACSKGGDSGKKEGGTTEIVFWHSYSGATEEALQSIIDDYKVC